MTKAQLLAVGSTAELGVAAETKHLLALRKTLIDQRAQANFKISEVDRRISELCAHEWKWHQVAGEGRYCTKCEKRDFDCDD